MWWPLAKWMHYRLSRIYGIQISPRMKLGYGLYIGHGVGIVINPSATIGHNVNLSQFISIGSNEGHAASIGDRVYIGPSVCVVEDVAIGHGACIAAGAVVIKDIPSDTTVAGVPAKVIAEYGHPEYIKNEWKDVE